MFLPKLTWECGKESIPLGHGGIGLPKYYPDESLKASFGYSVLDNNEYGPPGMLIKEFRFWNK